MSRLLAALALVAASTVSAAPVHRVTGHHGWDANAFIVEGEDAVVLVDALFLLPDVHALADRVERIGKPVAGLLLTHPHQDHFGGLALLRERLGDFPIVASAAAIAEIPRVHQQFQGSGQADGLVLPHYSRMLLPDTELAVDASLELGGMRIVSHHLGAGESVDAVVYEFPDEGLAFIGDIAMFHHHQYVGEGRPTAALAQLRELQARFGDGVQLMTGHGDSAPRAVIDAAIRYVEDVMAAADAAMADPANLGEDGHLTREARAAAAATLVERYADLNDFGFSTAGMIRWNIHGREQEVLADEGQ